MSQPRPRDSSRCRRRGASGTGVAELLRRLVDAVRADTAPPPDALGLVNLTTLPVYRIVNTAAAYRGAVVDQEVDALAEAVALDVLQVWISDLTPHGRGTRGRYWTSPTERGSRAGARGSAATARRSRGTATRDLRASTPPSPWSRN